MNHWPRTPRLSRFVSILFISLLLTAVSGTQALRAASPQNTNTAFTRTITIAYTGENQSAYEFELTLNTQALIAQEKMAPDCHNLKFTDNAGTEFAYFLESGCNTPTTQIWIQIPTLISGTNHLQMMYGPHVTSTFRREWANGQFMAPFVGTCPLGWQAASSFNVENRFARGAGTFGSTGGSETHYHTYAGNTSLANQTFTLTDAPQYTHPPNHGHTMSGATSSTNHLPPYKDVVFCQFMVGQLPYRAGSTAFIGFFETLPAGWSHDASFNGRFLRGSDTAGGTGGTNTHTHTYSGNTSYVSPNSSSNNTYSGPNNRGIGGPHRHSYSGTTNARDHLPPYLDMLMARPATANAALPPGSVGLFTQLPPLGWERYTALDGRFPRGSNTFGGTGGGASHNHAVSGQTAYADGGDHTRNSCCTHSSYDNHSHSYNLTSTTNNHLPPYLDAIFARQKTSLTTYTLGAESQAGLTIFPLTPSLLTFPSTIAQFTSPAQTITLSNTQSVSLTVTTLTLIGANPADFAWQNDTCTGQTITPGAGCAVSLRFTPQNAGEKSATLAMLAADPRHSLPHIPLSGVGVAPQALTVSINQGADDATELSTGSVSLGHGYLYVDASRVAIGLQFDNITIPQGAHIIDARLALTAQRNDAGAAAYTIAGEASDNAAPFQATTNNILARSQTTAVTEWLTIPAWTNGQVYQTPDLGPVLQEIVNRPGWAAGNTATFILTGSGSRRFWAHNGNAAAAARLVVNYAVVPPPRTWQMVSTAVSPSVQGEYALAYDTNRHVLVLYGGNATGWPYENATWEYDGVTWQRINTSQHPPALYGAAMVYDAAHSRVLLFGGSDHTDTAVNQTWVYDGISWTQLSPATSPPARAFHNMVYHAESGHTFLFGGLGGETFYNDTWEFDGTSWQQMITNQPPAGRMLAAFTHRGHDDTFWLFGGLAADGTPLADWWVLDPAVGNWTVAAASGGPAARAAASLVYEPTSLGLVLVGGSTQHGNVWQHDVWHYDAVTAWQQTTSLPTDTAYHAAVYDPDQQRILTFSRGQLWAYR